MTQFTRDDLIDIEYALKNLIKVIQDFAPVEPDTAEQVARLEDLQARVQGMLRSDSDALAEQPAQPPASSNTPKARRRASKKPRQTWLTGAWLFGFATRKKAPKRLIDFVKGMRNG